jgi:hypothetical protein
LISREHFRRDAIAGEAPLQNVREFALQRFANEFWTKKGRAL